jgi:hypothetical protein
MGFRQIIQWSNRVRELHNIVEFSSRELKWFEGYTADVICSFRNLTNNTEPAIFLPTFPVEGLDAVYFGMYSSCDVSHANLSKRESSTVYGLQLYTYDAQ